MCPQLLLQAEDETDVQAARLAKAEQVAEMAEFDETFSAQTSATPKEVFLCVLCVHIAKGFVHC